MARLREAAVVLAPRVALLLRGGDDPAVDDQRRVRVVAEEAADAERDLAVAHCRRSAR